MRLQMLAVFPVVATSVLSGCNLLLPEGSYLRNRLEDLTEVAHADLASTPALGALVNVGPALLGFHQLGHLEYGERLQLGLGGMVPLRTTNGSYAAGLIVPLSWAETRTAGGEPIDGYGARYPSLGSAGVDVGLLLGLGVRLDLVELADFLCGIGGVDLLGDDAAPPPSQPH